MKIRVTIILFAVLVMALTVGLSLVNGLMAMAGS